MIQVLEVFISQTVALKEQQNAFKISQKYLEITASLEDYVPMNPTRHLTSVSYTVGRCSETC